MINWFVKLVNIKSVFARSLVRTQPNSVFNSRLEHHYALQHISATTDNEIQLDRTEIL